MTHDKAAIRRDLRQKRDSFVADGCPDILPSPALLALFAAHPIIASYIAIGSEADPAKLTIAAREQGCIIALPHVVSLADPLSFHYWNADDTLEPGPFGLHQPAITAPMVTPSLILIPLIGFTRTGIRLGQGAGHYDRALSLNPSARRIGIAWSMQEMLTLPCDPWDIPLHAVLTERKFMLMEPI